MRCDACHGEGKLKQRVSEGPGTGADLPNLELPCPECNGSGFAHCCDGICAQPEDQRSSR
jgi:DnaJ-class molecular chaperone